MIRERVKAGMARARISVTKTGAANRPSCAGAAGLGLLALTVLN
jgi:hypothetical protein